METFLHTMASASYRIGIVSSLPSDAVIHKLSVAMFAEADENNDDGINSRTAFHVLCALLLFPFGRVYADYHT